MPVCPSVAVVEVVLNPRNPGRRQPAPAERRCHTISSTVAAVFNSSCI